MTRYVVLLNFSKEGVGAIKSSVDRAREFRAAAAKVGASVESQYWTLGEYDGVFVLSAPDEATAAALVLELGRRSSVRTTMLRAFDEAEFKTIVEKVG